MATLAQIEAPLSTERRPSASTPQRTVHRTIREDGICVLTLDRPNSSANVFDRRTLTELSEELDFLKHASGLKGLILISAKRSVFVAGADLHAMNAGLRLDALEDFIHLGQDVMNRLEALPITTVAAIHGAAVGGGYEICLACDYRVASPDRTTKIGLPETQLGILPAWGGSTRLPRLIGLPKALDIILGGKTVAAQQALRIGMIDAVVPAERLTEAAVRRISKGKPHRSAHLLVNNWIVASTLRRHLRSQLIRKTRGNYPALTTALDVVTKGVTSSMVGSLALEHRSTCELAQTDECQNLIRVFLLQERARKLKVTTPGASAEPRRIGRTAVIGAGVMGAGIAQWISAKHVPVILRDINTEQVAKGLATIGKLYHEGVKRHAFSRLEARDGIDRIFPAPSEVPLSHVDLVIEAAVEKMEMKQALFRRLDGQVGDDTILATNTSALSVSAIAEQTKRPERVIGLHFFNPVHRMQLVEIVVGRQTSPETVQRVLRFTQNLGKLPVIVKDSPGFLVNRILMPYLVEAGSLLEAGASIFELDEAMLDFGMPMGPLRLLDEVGLDVALHVAGTLAAQFGDRLQVPKILRQAFELGLLGRKRNRGFYLHGKSNESTPNPEVLALVTGRTAAELSRSELQERMVFLMINEAARCLEEEVVTEAADVDFAMIMGTGFAPFRGGPLRCADGLGLQHVVGVMTKWFDTGAIHFQPCALLRRLAAEGRRFYKER